MELEKMDVITSKCQTEKESWSCENMIPVEGDLDMEAEHYSCEVCGRTMKLYYDDMRWLLLPQLYFYFIFSHYAILVDGLVQQNFQMNTF